MQISTSQVASAYANVKQHVGEKNQNESKEAKGLEINASMTAKQVSNAYFMQYSQQIISQSSSSIKAQSGLFGMASGFVPENLADILNSIDYDAIGYTGKPISSLSQDEASALVGEDGFFGVAKTSERIAGFVLAGAGDDVEKLKAGREGILRGFNEAEKMWGGKLPDIAHETIEKSLKAIDEKLASLGASVVNIEA
ncbi:hydrogenase-4 component G [Campylobacter majalis]|uniref:hydrogenase-4 component G n=1 Tax=Campylobacter majalis TaxID=2790656 RepID=UPI003D680AB6